MENSSAGETFATLFAMFIMWVVLPVPYIYGLFWQAKHDHFGAFFANMVIPPWGWLNGVYHLFF